MGARNRGGGMSFDSFQAFLTMGGHGPYVWTVYLTTLVLLTLNFAGFRRERRRTLRELRSLLAAPPGEGVSPAGAESPGAGGQPPRQDK